LSAGKEPEQLQNALEVYMESDEFKAFVQERVADVSIEDMFANLHSRLKGKESTDGENQNSS